MLIYQVPNFSPNLAYYFCDSQATIDARPKDKQGNYIIPASQCSVGGQTDADLLLATNQQAWLTQQASLFIVDLQITVEGGVVWTVVDLNTEPENTDREYFVFDTTNGLYEEAIGLDAAKTLLTKIKQEYLVFTNMAQYITMTSWT